MEPKSEKDKDSPTSEEYNRFDALTRKLLAVPKEEIKRQQQAASKRKTKRRTKRYSS
jgi:hypothetical protein